MDDPMIARLPGIRQAYKILKDWHQEFAPRVYTPQGQPVPIRQASASQHQRGREAAHKGD